ncbi:hypothetical protein J6590_071430 [Homalodisca vitripennis]|nr:hypothetical protein J6590_071430 [Homalodisca vitripennis]
MTLNLVINAAAFYRESLKEKEALTGSNRFLQNVDYLDKAPRLPCLCRELAHIRFNEKYYSRSHERVQLAVTNQMNRPARRCHASQLPRPMDKSIVSARTSQYGNVVRYSLDVQGHAPNRLLSQLHSLVVPTRYKHSETSGVTPWPHCRDCLHPYNNPQGFPGNHQSD